MSTDAYKRNFDRIDWSKPMTIKRKRPYSAPPKRSRLDFPMVISDHMDPCIHPATGLWADSKSAFRSMTKAAGCIEIGNEDPSSVVSKPQRKTDRGEVVSDIKKALRENGVDVL